MRAADAFAKEFPRGDQVSLREHCAIRRGVSAHHVDKAELFSKIN
jgi:hypothetical protein